MTIVEQQREFYERLFQQHGHDPRSLDHRDKATQFERFSRLAQAFRREEGPFTVHEVGCGLGDFGAYLAERCPWAGYSGSDICGEFVTACQQRLPQGTFLLRDVVQTHGERQYDFLTLSGTFNMRLGASPDAWSTFVLALLDRMYALARKGIAVNFLTTYCDPEMMRDDLHYQDEKQILDHAVERLSRHYELDAGGPLYEYTLRLYRPEYVAALYPAPEFDRYFKRPASGP